MNSVINLLERHLGEGKPMSNNERLYYCPFCKHRKPKLQVNVLSGKWHCWVCQNINGSKGNSIRSLFFKMGLPRDVIDALPQNNFINFNKTTFKDEKVFMPLHSEPLWRKSTNPILKICRDYVMQERKISMNDIMIYNIHGITEGENAGYIVIPSYDRNFLLNYYILRSAINHELKYKFPPVSKNKIIFESYINWNLPVFLCEGVLDAIAIGFNAIPLLGKTPSDSLYKELYERRPPAIYVVLDSDAEMDSIDLMKNLYFTSVPVYFVEMQNGKDPSDVGRDFFWQEIYPKSCLVDPAFLEERKYKIQLSSL